MSPTHGIHLAACCGLLAVAAVGMAAEEPDPPEAPTPATTQPAAAPAGKVGARTAAMIAAGLPTLEAEKSPPKTGLPPPASPDAAVASGALQMPDFHLTAPKLPAPDEVLTQSETETKAMNTYLGPEDGFDRGFLNLFTVAGVWRQIPVLGRVPLLGFVTNRERAMAMYRADQQKQELTEFARLHRLAGPSKPTTENP